MSTILDCKAYFNEDPLGIEVLIFFFYRLNKSLNNLLLKITEIIIIEDYVSFRVRRIEAR